ncbi:hypothetical protein JIR001_23270 [Polycladomyces abyssicola]|uniref:Oxidoreductase n=1 Tax=Polycladomyces abyssicola TaxID=1125966 RepID=A0A8D5ZLI1_9BACL|nr:Gfo/Idh/MocA family oxidoreductase [Polycladomyces abyssicola]BCU82544.1 hypothetical protein JIR001_23270 [Polycladomyces abyssicola]
MKMGVIGYGRRIRNMLAEIRKADTDCRVVAITDVRNDEIRAADPSLKDVAFYEDYRLMLTENKLDGLLIGTRCSMHATIAVDVLPYGIPLFLEKPVATRMEDLVRLKSVADSTNTPVVVSFPLRTAPIVQLAKEIVNSGRIGSVEHVQAINNVPYGGVYYHHWYRDENETGGLFLQKATHDFDYIQYLLGERKPVRICAVTSKQIFKGDKPAGLKCRDCDERDTCPESMYRVHRAAHETPAGEYCCFAVDTGNEDSSSAIIQYDTGMHVAYSQNFVVRHRAGTRSCRLIGFRGTLEFDFYTNRITVHLHHTKRVETHQIGDDGEHFGGDAVLARNFIEVMRGTAVSLSPLQSGLDSALLCLKARESARTHTFQEVKWD